MNTCSGVAAQSKLFCLPSEKRAYSKSKEFAPFGVGPFQKGYWYTRWKLPKFTSDYHFVQRHQEADPLGEVGGHYPGKLSSGAYFS